MAKKKKEDITNVMRIISSAGVPFRDYAYDNLLLSAGWVVEQVYIGNHQDKHFLLLPSLVYNHKMNSYVYRSLYLHSFIMFY